LPDDNEKLAATLRSALRAGAFKDDYFRQL